MRRLILPVVSAAALGLSAVALPAAAAPVVAVAVAQDPVTEAELEAKAAEFEAVLEALALEIEAIRADTSLSEADRRARMEAAIDRRQPEIDAFTLVITGFVRQQALSEGASAEEAEAAVAMVEGMFRDQIREALLSGEIAASIASDGE